MLWRIDPTLRAVLSLRSERIFMSKPRTAAWIRGMIAATCILAVPGCGSSANGIGPENQLEVTNALDQFQFQLTALDHISDRRGYDWVNTGTQATIDISEAITGGSAILTITDAVGTVMYEKDIADDQDGTTPVGVAGTWRIEVVLSGTTGTFNFRVQKTT
jgi:hypothetical protein